MRMIAVMGAGRRSVTHDSSERRAMAYLDWNPAYDTGVAGIDYEHRRLVALLNEIHGLILSGAEPHKIAGALCAALHPMQPTPAQRGHLRALAEPIAAVIKCLRWPV
jgi:hypothetical protein